MLVERHEDPHLEFMKPLHGGTEPPKPRNHKKKSAKTKNKEEKIDLRCN